MEAREERWSVTRKSQANVQRLSFDGVSRRKGKKMTGLRPMRKRRTVTRIAYAIRRTFLFCSTCSCNGTNIETRYVLQGWCSQGCVSKELDKKVFTLRFLPRLGITNVVAQKFLKKEKRKRFSFRFYYKQSRNIQKYILFSILITL